MTDKKFVILSSIFFLLFIFGMGTFLVEKPISQFLRAQTATVSATKSFFTAIPQVGVIKNTQGTKDIKVDVYIRDEEGNSMPQKSVKLTTDIPQIEIAPSQTQITDSLGKATFVLKSTSPATANIKVEETTSATTLSQKLSIEFTNQ